MNYAFAGIIPRHLFIIYSRWGKVSLKYHLWYFKCKTKQNPANVRCQPNTVIHFYIYSISCFIGRFDCYKNYNNRFNYRYFYLVSLGKMTLIRKNNLWGFCCHVHLDPLRLSRSNGRSIGRKIYSIDSSIIPDIPIPLLSSELYSIIWSARINQLRNRWTGFTYCTINISCVHCSCSHRGGGPRETIAMFFYILLVIFIHFMWCL